MTVALLLTSLLLPGEKPAVYKLGGPRQVVAVVRDVDEDHEVRIRMLRVTAFDDVTNARLDRVKAEYFALQGLAKHLSFKGGSQIEISGGRVVASAKEGKTYSLTFRVPLKNVVRIRVDAKGNSKNGRLRFGFDGNFFTRKRELIETAKQLGRSLQTDLEAAEKKVTRSPKTVDAFLHRIAELEEVSETHWQKLRDEVMADRFLLTLERDDALTGVKAQEAAWIQSLAAVAKRYTTGREGDD